MSQKAMRRAALLFSVAGAMGLAADVFGQANVDLRNWTKEGNPSAGNWIVAADGSNVFQTVNHAPTYFVSNVNFYNTTIRGSFGVETTADDDFIGFVFGYQKPLAANSDDPLAVDYLLFDWKQATQGGALPGFRLAYVTGTEPGTHSTANPMWTHTSGPWTSGGNSGELQFVTLGTDTGAGKGWANNTHYNFELLYQADRIRINVQGGTGWLADGPTIFAVHLADVDPDGTVFGGAFPDGRFGFYNHSQERVRYQSFTEQADPVLSTTPAGGQALGFGAVRVGTSAAANLTIANAGGVGAATLTGQVGAASLPFAGPDVAAFALDEGESVQRQFTFAPAARGPASEDVVVSSNAPASPNATITLSGIGVGPVFGSSAAPGSLIDLGETTPGAPASILLQVSNLSDDEDGGLAALTNLTLEYLISGADASLFSVDLTPGSVVGRGDSLNILVTFLGAADLGDYQATLTLLTDEGVALGLTDFGASYSFDLASQVVPEPAALAWLALGGLALVRRRR